MNPKDVINAIYNGDDDALELSGWLFFFERVRALYRKKNWPAAEQATYVEILESPQTAVAALNARMLGDDARWAPTALDLAAVMRNEQKKPVEQPGRGPVSQRIDNTNLAYSSVRRLLSMGHRICECRPRPADWFTDQNGVITCQTCNGLEIGQVDQAQEAINF